MKSEFGTEDFESPCGFMFNLRRSLQNKILYLQGRSACFANQPCASRQVPRVLCDGPTFKQTYLVFLAADGGLRILIAALH